MKTPINLPAKPEGVRVTRETHCPQAEQVSINHPFGFCEPADNATEAETKIKNNAVDYEGDYTIRFWEETNRGEGFESKSFYYKNWQGVTTFAGRIVGKPGTVI